MSQKIHRCDECGKRRVGVTVVDTRDLCPECRDALSSYAVTVTAFDRISTRTVRAKSQDEAQDRALRDIGFAVSTRRIE